MNRKWRWLPFLLIMVFISTLLSNAEDNLMEPYLNGREKFNIGYTESIHYTSYAAHFYGILVGLQEMGWINDLEGIPYESGGDNSHEMWAWLVENQPSDYLYFVPGAYTSYDGDEEVMAKAIDMVQEGTPLDLMLAMGTTAGRNVTQEPPAIPVLVFSSSNAIASEIIASDTDSGKDNVWAHVDTKRYRKQVAVLHDIFQFKTLGIVYENSLAGRSYADLENVRAICEELGVTLIEKHVNENANADEYPRYYEDMESAFQEMAEEVDAFYLTAGNLAPTDLPDLFEPFYNRQIPVFSQLGGEEVETAAIMSTAANYIDIGRYGAQIVSKSLHGENPRYLYATYEDIPLIVININNARKIGYTPDFEILLIADKIYYDSEK